MKRLVPALLALAALLVPQLSGETNMPQTSATPPARTESLVLGGGCFWCVEAQYKLVPGVLSVESGYAGGSVDHPTYEQVCSGTTGHAEVVRITFDPERVGVARLLELFWDAHDPTTLNRQGADVGTQYRSVILYSGEEQRAAAEKSRADATRRFRDPIVTQIAPLTKFFPAEAYHQDYFRNNPGAGYCRMVVAPKVEKFRKALGH